MIDRVTGEPRPEIRGEDYPLTVSSATLAIGSDFEEPEGIFHIDDAFFARRVLESAPVSPIIPLSDSQLLSIFGKEAGGHGWFKFQVPFAPA